MHSKWLLGIVPAALLFGVSLGALQSKKPEGTEATRASGPAPSRAEPGSERALSSLLREMEGLREEVRQQASHKESEEEPKSSDDSESDVMELDPELAEQREAQIAQLDRVLARVVGARELSADAALELRQSLDELGPDDHSAQMQRIAQLANSGAFSIAPHLERPF